MAATDIQHSEAGTPPTGQLSIVHGPADVPLLDFKLADFLDFQCIKYGSKECLVIPWTGARWTYEWLRQESVWLARAMAERGIRPGDRIGIMAGNCEHYAVIFFACTRIGAILVILNNTYTASEAHYALEFTGTAGWPLDVWLGLTLDRMQNALHHAMDRTSRQQEASGRYSCRPPRRSGGSHSSRLSRHFHRLQQSAGRRHPTTRRQGRGMPPKLHQPRHMQSPVHQRDDWQPQGCVTNSPVRLKSFLVNIVI